jgi:hypothetical protein
VTLTRILGAIALLGLSATCSEDEEESKGACLVPDPSAPGETFCATNISARDCREGLAGTPEDACDPSDYARRCDLQGTSHYYTMASKHTCEGGKETRLP